MSENPRAQNSQTGLQTRLLELTKSLIFQVTKLEDLIGWEPWEPTSSLNETYTERLALTHSIETIVDELANLQGFGNKSDS